MIEFTRPFNEEEFNSWQEKINDEEKNNIQKMKKIKIGNVGHTVHLDTSSYHSDNHQDTSHRDQAGSHTQTGTSYTKSWYEQGHQHRNNVTGGHHVQYGVDTNEHYTYTTVDSDGNVKELIGPIDYSVGGGYYDNIAHADMLHADDHTQYGYNQTIPHSDFDGYDYGYSQYVPHSNYSTYNQQHIDFENYVPTAPRFYELENKKVCGNIDVNLYAYDANKFGFGSDWDIAKKVEYKLEIRKIQNLNGSSDVTNWVTLQEFKENPKFNFDTTDPLLKGNVIPDKSNGIYQLRATARNPEFKGYEFIGESKVTTITIEQNHAPKVRVKNGNEFIEFTFGKERVLSRDKDIKEYSNLYSEKTDEIKGVFVALDITDKDFDNYVKGYAIMKDKDENVIDKQEIIFSNGKNVVKTEGKTKNGYVFFPLNNLLRKKHDKNKIEIVVKDYFDEATTIATKTVVVQRTVSEDDLRMIKLDVDELPPELQLDKNIKTWTNQNIKINVKANDISGIWKVRDCNKRDWSNSNFEVIVDKNGEYEFEAVDNVGNRNKKIISVNNIDKEPPEITCDLSILKQGKINVTDKLSGVNEIQYALTDTKEPPRIGYTSISNNSVIKSEARQPYLHVRAWDKAGNYNIKTFRVRHLEVKAVLNPNPALQGQKIIFAVETTGFANEIDIKFPDELTNLDYVNINNISCNKIKEELEHIERIRYYLPLDTPKTIDKNGKRIKDKYKFIISAKNKEGVVVDTIVTLDVTGNILDGIRTRMK